MRAPEFWKNENVISFLLYPLSLIYGFARYLHVFFNKEYKTNLKIICVGNITVGGSGKTPVALKIGDILKEKKIDFAFLSKGYKGNIKEFTKIDLSKHTAIEVGDEPLLLAEKADTFICNNRKNAIRKLSTEYRYKVIVMDDGFQNPTIYKDISLVVVDGEYGFGNKELLPSGPLREPIFSALERASAFIIIGQDKHYIDDYLSNANMKTFRACIKEKNISNNKNKYIAFSGIGRNDKFFYSLKKANFDIEKQYSYGDHYNYTTDDIDTMLIEAQLDKAKLITTKKDWIRLDEKYKTEIEFLDVEIDFYDNDDFVEFILK